MEQKGTIHCHLSTIMGERKMKIVDVINATGVGRLQVSRMYKEEHLDKMTLGTYAKIAEGLGIPLSELVSYDPSETVE